MTLIEAITHIDTIKPNQYSQPDKIRWLSNLDWTVKTEIIDTHEGAEGVIFNGYDVNTPLDTELLIPQNHSDCYSKWLEAQIDYANGEYGKYNNSTMAFNDLYAAFERWYNRTHMPKGTKLKFF